MNTLTSQQEFDDLWELLDREATDAKFSHQAVMELSRLYSHWSAESQQTARRAIGRWLLSNNPRKRFDALVLVEQFLIVEAERELNELKMRLEGVAGPEATFELRKVNDVRAKLARQLGGKSFCEQRSGLVEIMPVSWVPGQARTADKASLKAFSNLLSPNSMEGVAVRGSAPYLPESKAQDGIITQFLRQIGLRAGDQYEVVIVP